MGNSESKEFKTKLKEVGKKAHADREKQRQRVQRQREQSCVTDKIEFWNITDLVHPLNISQRHSHLVYGYMRAYYDFPLREGVGICLKYVGYIKIISQTDQENIYEGYLQKESLHLKQFRKRWVVLKGHCLYSFKDCTNREEPTEIIDLKLYFTIKQSKNSCQKFYIESLSPNNSNRSFISLGYAYEWYMRIRRKLPIYTNNAKLIDNIDHIIHININFKATNNTYHSDDKFIICASYLKEEKMENIFDCIKGKYQPLLITFNNITFGGRRYKHRRDLNDTSLIYYNRDSIICNGLQINASIRDIYTSRRCDFSEYDAY